MNISFRNILLTACFASFLVFYTNCSPGFVSTSSNVSDLSLPTLMNNPPIAASANNVLPVSVGCGGQGYANEPCVSVTICLPGTSTCQTVNNVLLDTGSFGLRLFSSSLTISPSTVADPNTAGNTLAECVTYGDGSSDWGPLANVNVILGSETATNVPIQLINSTYGSSLPSSCTNLDTGFNQQNFNGILGVGLFPQDCGSGCAPDPNVDNSTNGIYYTCTAGGNCQTGVTVTTAMQVTNPVTMLPTDNNGVILELPAVAIGGSTAATGSLVLGIGTEANNQPMSPTVLPADDYGNFVTVFGGQSMSSSFIDSGSEALMFPSTTVTACGDSSFYCPANETVLSATQQGANGSGSATVIFAAGNGDSFLAQANPNLVFSDLAAPSTGYFDWGLPFFLGRDVYVGFYGQSSSLGTGPLWAF